MPIWRSFRRLGQRFRCLKTRTFSSSTTKLHNEQFLVSVDEMRSFVISCMESVGANKENGSKVADLLIVADQRGHYSHGLNRLRIYMEDCRSGNCVPNAQPTIIKQKAATAWVDGSNGLGAVVGHYCTELAIQLAKEHGVGWVVCKGSNHYGIAGYWPLLMKERGFLVDFYVASLNGISGTNTSPLVFPTRAAQHALGTNPLAFVAPALNDDNFALDMATSSVALGKIELAERKGEHMNNQWGLNSQGKLTSDPKDVTQRGGGLTPLGGSEETGGYKGSGLGMMVEVMCSILAGATYGKNGQCFVAIDPECFAPDFSGRLQTYLDETRQLKPADSNKRVMVAGDPERKNIARCPGKLIYGRNQIDHLLDIAQQNSVQPFQYQKSETVV
ncbi:Malate/L-lactate dehydrogenase [Aphelenchoides bicaudatus]|nr:Malate/L-lactate dehydrogenase [Aphelenchoides bicaudatus]